MQEGRALRPPQADRKRVLLNRMGSNQWRSTLRCQADQPCESALKKLVTNQAGAWDATADETPQHREFP